MSDPVSLEQIKKEAHRTFNQDGLLYLFIAVLLTAVGLSFYDSRFGFLGGLAYGRGRTDVANGRHSLCHRRLGSNALPASVSGHVRPRAI